MRISWNKLIYCVLYIHKLSIYPSQVKLHFGCYFNIPLLYKWTKMRGGELVEERTIVKREFWNNVKLFNPTPPLPYTFPHAGLVLHVEAWVDDELLSRLSLSLTDIRCTQWPLCAVVLTLCYRMSISAGLYIFITSSSE